ncbi:hypothetical protein ACHWQZ_G004021 [Mnemiopsis leidyi]
MGLTIFSLIFSIFNRAQGSSRGPGHHPRRILTMGPGKKGAETESRKRRKNIREGLCDCVWTEEGREKGGAKEMDGVGRNKKERGRGEDGVDEGRRRD